MPLTIRRTSDKFQRCDLMKPAYVIAAAFVLVLGLIGAGLIIVVASRNAPATSVAAQRDPPCDVLFDTMPVSLSLPAQACGSAFGPPSSPPSTFAASRSVSGIMCP